MSTAKAIQVDDVIRTGTTFADKVFALRDGRVKGALENLSVKIGWGEIPMLALRIREDTAQLRARGARQHVSNALAEESVGLRDRWLGCCSDAGELHEAARIIDLVKESVARRWPGDRKVFDSLMLSASAHRQDDQSVMEWAAREMIVEARTSVRAHEAALLILTRKFISPQILSERRADVIRLGERSKVSEGREYDRVKYELWELITEPSRDLTATGARALLATLSGVPVSSGPSLRDIRRWVSVIGISLIAESLAKTERTPEPQSKRRRGVAMRPGRKCKAN